MGARAGVRATTVEDAVEDADWMGEGGGAIGVPLIRQSFHLSCSANVPSADDVNTFKGA